MFDDRRVNPIIVIVNAQFSTICGSFFIIPLIYPNNRPWKGFLPPGFTSLCILAKTGRLQIVELGSKLGMSSHVAISRWCSLYQLKSLNPLLKQLIWSVQVWWCFPSSTNSQGVFAKMELVSLDVPIAPIHFFTSMLEIQWCSFQFMCNINILGGIKVIQPVFVLCDTGFSPKYTLG